MKLGEVTATSNSDQIGKNVVLVKQQFTASGHIYTGYYNRDIDGHATHSHNNQNLVYTYVLMNTPQ